MPNFIIGESYLTDAESERLSTLSIHSYLYNNSYDSLNTLFKNPDQLRKEINDKWLQIGVALPGLIAKVSGDFLFGEELIIKTEDEQNEAFFEEYFDECFRQCLYEAAITQSYQGGIIIKFIVKKDIDGKLKPCYQFLPQSCYFPVFKPFTNEVERCYIITEETFDDKKSLLLVEEHIPGIINYFVFKIDTQSKKIEEILNPVNFGFPQSQPTGLEEIPIIYLPNFKELGDYFGKSDYDGIEGALLAINWRLTQNEHNLHLHGGGKMQGPAKQTGQSLLVDQHMRPINGGAVIDYLTIPRDATGAVGAQYSYIQPALSTIEDIAIIKELLKFIFLVTDISPDVFGLGEQGVPESGKALKMRLMRTLTMIGRKARRWEMALEKLANMGMTVLNIEPNFELEIPDGVKEDQDEEIARHALMVQNGFETQKDAIKCLHGCDDKEAERIMADSGKETVEKEKNRNAGFVA